LDNRSVLALAFVALMGVAMAAKLQSYNVDLAGTTVSGLSSGGFMAVQMHFAFSKNINGAAIFAGGPYYCAQGSESTAITSCMSSPAGINVNTLTTTAKNLAKAGSIDSLDNLTGQKVFIYSGSKDTTVKPGVCKAMQTMYQNLGAKVTTSYDIASQHCWPTDNYGNQCAFSGEPYINNCKYDGAQQALNVLYGTLNPQVAAVSANIIQVDQTEFNTAHDSLGSTAYVYVPTACQGGAKCRLHIALHGCLQTLADIGTKFVEDTELNPIAEANNIIVLYPQASKSTFNPSNPNGCWDWWGYTSGSVIIGNTKYVTQAGPQMNTIWSMAKRIAGGKGEEVEVDFQSVDY